MSAWWWWCVRHRHGRGCAHEGGRQSRGGRAGTAEQRRRAGGVKRYQTSAVEDGLRRAALQACCARLTRVLRHEAVDPQLVAAQRLHDLNQGRAGAAAGARAFAAGVGAGAEGKARVWRMRVLIRASPLRLLPTRHLLSSPNTHLQVVQLIPLLGKVHAAQRSACTQQQQQQRISSSMQRALGSSCACTPAGSSCARAAARKQTAERRPSPARHQPRLSYRCSTVM